MTDLNIIGAAAKDAAFALANASTAQKDAALMAIAAALEARAAEILSANREDVEAARAGGMSPSMLDRLSLSEARVKGMAEGVRDVAKLPDPVGRVLSGSTLACGLAMEKIAVPLGVIGIIFEARPNVTSDAAALCLKSGNACILRGGKEAIRSNTAIAKVMRGALREAGLNENCICLVEDTDRATATAMMRLNRYIDCLIPRGGAGLIRSVVENATVPSSKRAWATATPMWKRAPTSPWPRRSSSTPRPRAPRCATRWRRCWWTRPSPKRRCRSSPRG